MKTVIIITELCIWMMCAYLMVESLIDSPKCNTIEFAEWLGRENYTMGCNISFEEIKPGEWVWYHFNNEKRKFSTKELYELYLKSK